MKFNKGKRMKLINVFFVFIFFTQLVFAQSEDDSNSKQSVVPKIIPITVTIGGDFIVTGSFSAFPTQRVDHFITQIFLEAKKEALSLTNEIVYTKRIIEEIDKYSLRNILLKRADGTERKIDLEKFRITGNFDDNPYLLYDDVLIFPAIDITKDYVAINGAVNKPRTIQFVEGDKLSDAILFSMGISKAYENVEKAEITRQSYDGKSEQLIIVSIKDDFELKRGDRIRIIARGDAAELLLEKDGITELEMKDIERRLRWSNFEMGRLSNLTVEDTSLFLIDNELRFFNQIGNLDFSNLQDSNSEAGNFIVKDGDLILVPEFENIVNIFGQVPNSGKYNFVKGYDYKYYIKKAGGFSEFAEEDEVILIKGKGKNWIPVVDEENIVIEPGDFIWVPKEPQRTLEYYLRQASIIAGILGPIATIIVILVTNSGN